MSEGRGGDRGAGVIGLAGGIGAGKSAVARVMAELGCVVSDSDALARAALERDDVRAQLVSWWGEGVISTDGKVDRGAVSRIVFGDDEQRLRLEALVHPLVRVSRGEAIARARDAGARAFVIDAPLLFEAGLDAECDVVVFVDAPREVRLARVREHRGWDEAELDRREAAQLAVEEKRRRADVVVLNDGDGVGDGDDGVGVPDALAARVSALLDRIAPRIAPRGGA